MKALIAGCGYVGTELGRELVRQGHEVYGLRRSTGAADDLIAAGIRPVAGDVTRLDNLRELPGPFDWVVNTVSSSQGDGAAYRAAYLDGMHTLVAWLKNHPPRKFAYTSSTGVYAQNDGSVVDETSPAEPASPMSQVLIGTERVALDAVRQDGLPAVILRVAGIYGPGRGYWFKRFLHDEPLAPGEGERLSNMIHRDDVAGALIAALERGQPGEIYNAADDEPVTAQDFFRWLAVELERPRTPLAMGAAEASAAPRKRAATNKRVANRKLKTELGYHFKYPTFREGYAAEIDRLRRSGDLRPRSPH